MSSDPALDAFLLDLKAQDVRVWLDGDALRVSAPKDALTPALRDGLAARKSAILALLRAARDGEPPRIAPRGADAGPLPLSFDQQRIWFLQQLSPQGVAFHLQTSLVVAAAPPTVEQAWAALLRRHEVLRTTYADGPEGPVQVVQPPGRPALPSIDLVGLADAALATAMAVPARAALRQPFDLVRGPVWRLLLFRLSGGRTAVFVFVHHVATDGWSLARLNAELRELCEAGAAGRAPRLPELPVQYADFALWQRRWLQGDVLAAQLDYWRARLAGMPRMLELPLDHPRPAQQSGDGGVVRLTLPAELATGLRRTAAQHQATPFMLLLALFKVLLARHSGHWDVVVGTPIAGRTQPDLEHVQGLFLNSLVLRTALDPALPFTQVLQRVRETLLGAFAHQSLPFQKLVDELRPPRDLSRNPLFQAMFNMLVAGAAGGLDDAAADADQDLAGSVQVDLALDVLEDGDACTLAFNYSTDLFDRSTLKRLAAQYLRLAQAVVADPGQAAGAIDLLGEEERARLLRGWNDTAEDFDETPVSRQFEHRAAATPDAPALEFEDRRLSYAELNARANRLARQLRARIDAAGRTGPHHVGIHLQRGVEMVVAVLAVMKAGAAYVPLDPAYPRVRLEFMLADSAAVLLLTQASLVGDLDPGRAEVVCADRDAAVIAAQGSADLEPGPGPGDLAYMIYTSGSTGRPKGVQIEHRSLANFLHAMARRPGLAADDVLLAVTTLSFDIAGLELYLPLTRGARLVLAGRDTAADGRALARLMARCGATVMQATPATWRLLLAAGWTGDPRLKLLCGGEALPRELALALRQRCASLWNLYGPTETTVWSTLAPVDAGRGPVPIGRPIANTRVYVLDPAGAPVPVGVAGELHIGGAGVARGYWRRADLTADRFVPDRYSDDPGARLYRTGDRARFLGDGQLEYLGRLDTQVKLRGHRIELGEIESVLGRVGGVAVAAVAVREDRPGDQRLVAYVERDAGATVTEDALRSAAASQLPAFMVPGAWVFPDRLPLTPNGKIDRKALPAPPAAAAAAAVTPRNAIEGRLAAIWQDVLRAERVGVDDNFFDIGGHSLLVVAVQGRVREALGVDLPVVEFFAYPTIAALAARLAAHAQPAAAVTPGPQRGLRAGTARRARRIGPRQGEPEQVAVVGLSGRFPGADDIAQFWALLCEGREAITFFDPATLLAEGTDPELLRHPDFVPAKGVARDVDLFDAGFFKYSPADAEALDPQQRLFLQCAWHALEDAGYDSERCDGAVGVYAATSLNSYTLRSVLAQGDPGHAFLNDKDFLATRVAYKLDLRGPGLTVQTACSSSLVALAEACESLLDHRCDMALAGGVSVGVPVVSGYVYQEGGIRSRDGHCRPFDARADGCVGGDGVAVVVLKRLSDALADGDTVHAVVKGVAVNNDGANKVGFTAPSVSGQAEVIASALAVAGVDADNVGYVETHGTGTVLGDPIEMAALTQAFRATTGREGYCAVGTLKPNIGHLDAAAGIAGFVKAVLCLRHRMLPPSLHYETPNPKIDFEHSPFRVNSRLTDWPASDGRPRRAGVSAFGIGGTNVHAVLEEAPAAAAASATLGPQLLVVSARSEAALEASCGRLAAHLRAHAELNLADVACTLLNGRRAFEYRACAVCADLDDAVRVFGGEEAARLVKGRAPPAAPDVVFMFSGQGAQYPGMARGLYDAWPVFRDEVDRCCDLLRPLLGLDLRAVLYPQGGDGGAAARECGDPIHRTEFAQPALFVVEYALARLWMACGVVPAALIGHSIGEVVAACVAGVMTLPDALAFVALRGRLMQSQPDGVMLGVPLGAGAVVPFLRGSVGVAAVNTASLCVVSGPAGEVAAVEQALAAAGHHASRLQTSHAFHSAMMAPVAAPLALFLRGVPLAAPGIPYLSNLSGDWVTDVEATDPDRWGRHVVAPVQFAGGLSRLFEQPRACIEIGPGSTLCTFAREQAPAGSAPAIVASVRRPREPRDDAVMLLAALGQLWLGGVALDATRLPGGSGRRRVQLPGYPFEGRRYWLPMRSATAASTASTGPLDKRPDSAQWCYLPTWTSAPPLSDDAPAQGRPTQTWLVFLRPGGIAEALLTPLRARGDRVVEVAPADRFRVLGDGRYAIDPTDPGGYRKLLDALHAAGLPAGRVVHAWGVAGGCASGLDAALDAGFYSVLYLVQALAARPGPVPSRLDLLTEGTLAVTGEESLRPEAAPVLGLAQVVPQEMPGAQCNVIDLGPAADAARRLDALLGELAGPGRDPLVALRHRRRWLPRFEPAAATGRPRRLPARAAVLITGGLGGVGLALAEHLARTRQARLVLVGRSRFPAPGEWDAWLAAHDPADATRRRIERLRGIEAAGAEVMVATADVADAAAMRAVAAAVARRFGALQGWVHAAGVLAGPSLAPLLKLTRAECEAQFRAKVRGLQVLDEVFDAPTLDLAMVVSSVSVVLGGLGLAAYAAANRFMDALVQARHAEGATHWLSVDWDAWQFEPPEAAPRRGSLAALALTPAEGVQVFDRVLGLGPVAQVVVSTADLPRRIERGRMADPAAEDAAGPAARTPAHGRPALASSFVAPRSDLERAIAEVWQELLGIDKVGIYDNFFDLGGHSLLAVRAAARLREKLGVNLSLEKFLELGTIDQVAWQSLGQLAATLGGETAPPAAPAAVPALAQLDPFFFGAEDRRLFGILRRAPAPRRVGVVLCAPHAHEYVRCHRALRELGVALAGTGFDVLSFDYFGTGDSGGEYDQASIEGWRGDAVRAIDELRRRLDLDAACIVGLRLGGALALLAARDRADLRAVALWDPIVAGADIEGETAEIAALQALPPAQQRDVQYSDVLAFPVTASMTAAVGAIDLCAGPMPAAGAMLVLETGAEGRGRRLADLARSHGSRADYRRVDEARVWTREPYEAVSPRETLAALVAWLDEVAR